MQGGTPDPGGAKNTADNSLVQDRENVNEHKKNNMIVEKIKQCGTINLERTLRETETNMPKERKCFSMKKIAPILLAMVLALTLCLVGFADAESYDDDPLEETAASTSEEALEEAEPVPARSSECDACGKVSCVTPKKDTFETGPEEVKCIHYPHGTDEVYYQHTTYYQVCGSCGYKSGTWTVDEGESLRYCHGWSATKH